MYKNYLKLALRHLLKNKVYAAINIVGLAVALASTFYILIYVINEFSYDDYNIKHDRIYRVTNYKKDFNITYPSAAFCFAPFLSDNFNEVERFTRTQKIPYVKIKMNEEFVEQRNFLSADQDIFEIFTFPIVLGSAEITDKNSVVISEKTAEKYFGNENPINKILTAQIGGTEKLFKVTGVMKNIPPNSTLSADIIGNINLSLESMKSRNPNANIDFENNWNYDYWWTYLLLKKNTDKELLEEKLAPILEKHLPEEVKDEYKFQRLKDVYLEEMVNNYPQGNLKNIYLFLIIGLAILLIACSNYMILSSALSNNRAKEIGIRKVSGATKQNIIYQVLGESVLLTLIALIFAILFAEVFQGFAKELFDYKFNFIASNLFQYAVGFLIITIAIGIFSGLYVAVYLSSFQVVNIIKHNLLMKDKGRVRKILILVQLIIFVIAVFSSIIIYSQHKYFLNIDLGFENKNLIFITYNRRAFINSEAFVNNIREHHDIINSARTMFSLPDNSSMRGSIKRFDDPTKEVEIESTYGSANFIETLGLKLIEGKSLQENSIAEMQNEVVLNEKAVEVLRIENPIGKKIAIMTIVGVVKDFNLHSLHSEIPPMFIGMSDDKYFSKILIRYKEGTFKSTIDIIENEWNKIAPNIPFEYETIEQTVAKLYEEEETLFRIVSFFTFLIILLGASGLFGLTLFTLKKKTKEIGIRRVLGASFNEIIIVLSKEFVLLIILASIIALPIGFYFMNNWLQNFVYKYEIGLLPFLISGITVLLIGILAISIQTIKTARTNPVESLRDE